MLNHATTIGGSASTSPYLHATKVEERQAPARAARGRRVGDFVSAGQALLAQFKEVLCTRLLDRYPGAPEEIIISTAEGAVRLARRYDDCRVLTDDVLDQAIRTTIRHKVLPYDGVLEALGGRLPAYLHQAIQATFAYVADLIAKEFAKPRVATIITVQKPKRRRPWPPRAGWWK